MWKLEVIIVIKLSCKSTINIFSYKTYSNFLYKKILNDKTALKNLRDFSKDLQSSNFIIVINI